MSTSIGFAFAPRLTRLLGSMFTAYAIADAAQFVNSAAEERS